MTILKTAEAVSRFLWGFPVLILFIGGGIYLSIRLKFPQRRIIIIFRTTFKALGEKDGTSPLSAMQGFSTSLAAAVGTGSVAGVGAAMAVGGRGAVFWMWVSAFLGMGISCCENLLGASYREKNGRSGAFSYISAIPHGKALAAAYAVFTVLASLGMGNMAQASSVTSAMHNAFGMPKHITAILILIFTFTAVMGKTSAAALCEKLVPFMAALFILGSAAVILIHPVLAVRSLASIFTSALSPRALLGGAAGTVCIEGLKRGAFSNEAGLGSSAAVHSSCECTTDRKLGIMSMCEVFIDTMVICTLTALVILISGAELTPDSAVQGYSQALGFIGKYFIGISLSLFALATIAGWFFIGEKAWSYLFKNSLPYCLVYIICAFSGAIYDPTLILALSDIFNALMALPNMLAVLMLSGELSSPFDTPPESRQKPIP